MPIEKKRKVSYFKGFVLLLCVTALSRLYAQDSIGLKQDFPAKTAGEHPPSNMFSIESMNINTEMLPRFVELGILVADVSEEENNLNTDEIIFSDEYDDTEIDPSFYEEETSEQQPVETIDVQIKAEQPEPEDILKVDDILVTGEKEEALVEPKSILEGDELTKQLGSTLGETLQNQPGVHNSTFGPGVGLPVIRGLSGSRVQILQSSMGSFDASSVSPDHAVPIEPLLAENIEVLRGPATLKYSGNAMGGAVDVKSGRIPQQLPENGFDGGIETRYDSNPNHKSGVFKINGGKGPVVIHADGFSRKSQNIEIAGNALKEDAVREVFGNTEEFENTEGEVLNSDLETSSLSLGASLVSDLGYIGVAVNKYDNNYGIPPGGTPPHCDPTPTTPCPAELPPDNLRIDMLQTRWDAEAKIYDLFSGIDSVTFKATNVDYKHAEFARNVASTRFESMATQLRFELEHSVDDFLQGSIGYQWSDQQFGAFGLESFITDSDLDNNSFFIVETLSAKYFKFEFGFRREEQSLDPVADEIEPFPRWLPGVTTPLPDVLDHVAHSNSVALQIDPLESLSFRVSLTKGERIPAIQELIANGPHFATRSFERGNENLTNEFSSNLDLGVFYQSSFFDINLNVFRNKIKDYIYVEPSTRVDGSGNVLTEFYSVEVGDISTNCVRLSDCFPLYQTFQRDAVFHGYEANLGILPPVFFDIDSKLTFFTDYVRGYFKEEGRGDVPRLPPRRFGINLDAIWQDINFQARWTRALSQKRPGLFETSTEGYNRFDATLAYEKKLGLGNSLLFFLKGKNLSNAEIRHSTSFLRNFAPEQGRSIEAGLRWSF